MGEIDEMSSDEFSGWIAYLRVHHTEGWDMTAQICQVTVGAMTGEAVPLKRFLPQKQPGCLGRPDMTEDELRKVMMAGLR